MLGAMDLGVTDDSERADHEQAAQIAVTLFADTAQPVLAPVCTENSNPDVAMVEPAQDRV